MNKLFRLVSVFAIAGATFAYTGCTDYSEDINEVDKRVDQVESNLAAGLSDVKSQIGALEATVKGVQEAQAKADAAITALQSALGELQNRHANDIAQLKKDYAAADAALKSEIQGKIDALAATHAADVKAVNAAIEALKADVATLYAKAAEVEKVIPTLATKKEVEEVANAVAAEIAKINTAIGALQGDLEVAQKDIIALQTRMTDAEGDIADLQEAVAKAQKAADDAQTAADKAQEDATAALGNIAALKAALGVYAEQGALEAKIAALEAIDSTLEADKFDTKDFGAYFAAELKNVIGVYAEKGVLEAKIAALDAKDADLQAQITALDKKVDEAVKALEKKISDLDAKVEAYNKALNARINAVLGIIENRLSSIAFVPSYYYDGVPAIMFETIAYNPLKANDENDAPIKNAKFDPNSPTSADANAYKNFTSAVAKAKYRLNPRTVGVDCADFSFVGDKADYIITRANAPAAPISIVGEPVYDAATGYVTFSVKKDEKLNVTANENKKLDIVALKAVLKKGLTEDEAKAAAKPEVYSEYAHVNEVAYQAADLAISDKALLAKKDGKHEYAKTFDAAKAEAPRYEIYYNKEFDLKELVATCISTDIKTPGLEAEQSHAALDLEKYNLEYSFSVANSDYKIASGATETNQQTVIECIDAEKGLYRTITAQGYENNKESIGRTPIVRVDLKHDGNIVARAFIKVIIVVDKAFQTINVSDINSNVVLKCPDTKVSLVYDEETLREAVYRVFNINHVAFWDLYEFDKAYVTKNGKASSITAPELLDGVASDGKATKKVVWNFTHGEVGKIGDKSVVTGCLVLKNKLDAYSEYPTNVTFTFTVNFTLPEVKTTIEINDIFWKDGVLQANVNRPESTTDIAANCYFATPIENQPWKVRTATGFPCGKDLRWRIIEVFANGNKVAKTSETFKGVQLVPVTVDGKTETGITLVKTNASVKAALNSEKGLQAIVEWYAVAESGDEYILHQFTVNFIRPVNLNLPEGLSVKDAVTGGDEITFGYAGLLTDWRGELILPPSEMEVLEEGYFWNKVCSPADHAVLVPGYTKVVKEGYYDVEFEDVEVAIPGGAGYYKATAEMYIDTTLARIYKEQGELPADVYLSMHGTKYQKLPDLTAEGRSKSEAESNVRAKVNAISSHFLDPYVNCGMKATISSEYVINSTSTEFTFKTVKKVTYHEAELVQVEPDLTYSKCNEKPGPAVSGEVYTEGQRIGCWQWQKWSYTTTKAVAGQYWDFYGEIKDIKLDITKVTTDLADKKLPSGASLVQVGYNLKYENVLSPIQYSYHIFIPASIEYGWGTLNSTLVITVNPVSTL